MERERYDGADIAHLLHARAEALDWGRLARRFGRHWRVLLSHLILFGFIYPSERTRIPEPLMRRCLQLLDAEMRRPSEQRVCRGTDHLARPVSGRRAALGLRGRPAAPARGSMTESDASIWTAAIDEALSRPVGADAIGESEARREPVPAGVDPRRERAPSAPARSCGRSPSRECSWSSR